LSEFAERYYPAVRAFIGAVAHNRGDIDDLTQRFFEAVVLSGRLLALADRDRGPFRPYLKRAIRNFLVDEYRRQARSLQPDVHPDANEEGWQDLVPDDSPAPDREMLRAWARSLVALAVERTQQVCEARGQSDNFAMFARRYLADDKPPSWRDIGASFGLEEKVARSRADTAARQFRTILRQLIAADVGESDADVDEELRSVMSLL
jgi:RNA polymerase sigma factor (sigma-70 family)